MLFIPPILIDMDEPNVFGGHKLHPSIRGVSPLIYKCVKITVRKDVY